jgi:hypothetical protein
MFPSPLSSALAIFVLIVSAAFMIGEWRRRRPGVTLRRLLWAAVSSDWVVFAAAIPALAGTLWLLKASTQDVVNADIDMKVSGGKVAQLYVNEQWTAPFRAPLVVNARHNYRFSGLPNEISHLRLDPANVADATIVLCGIAIRRGSTLVRRIGADEIKGWTFVEMSQVGEENGCLVLQTSTVSGRLFAATQVSAGGQSAVMARLVTAVRDPHVYSLGFIGAFLLFLLAGLRRKPFLQDAIAVSLMAVAAFPVAWLVMRLPTSPLPVAQAVGMASFQGYPKVNDHLISIALLFCAVGAGWLASRLRVSGEETACFGETGGLSRYRWVVHVLVLLALAGMFQPDLPATFDQLKAQHFTSQDWDMQNSITWRYLIASGQVPFRDFWFPYSGFYLHLRTFPFAHIVSSLYTVTTLWFLYLGLVGLARERLRLSLAVFGLVLVALVLNVFWGWSRYVLALDVVLLYLNAAQTKRLRLQTALPLGLISALAFFYEPAQFFYASAGIVLHVALDLLWPIPRPFRLRQIAVSMRDLLRERARTVGIPMATGVAAVLVLLAASGMLPGFLAFQLSMGVQSVYGAWPAHADDWALPIVRFKMVFLLFFLLIAVAVRRWTAEGEQRRPALTSLLLLGAAGFIVWQKQLDRPHNWEVVQIYPFILVVLYAVSVWRGRTIPQGLVAGCFMGCTLALAVHQGIAVSLARLVVASPQTAIKNARFLRSGDPGVARATLDLFTPAHLTAFTQENEALRQLTDRYGMTSADRIFVLGDDSLLYVLRNQEPPYMINLYNDSPINEQERTVRWLEQDRPRFVLWDPANATFDFVPNLVRVPLIYRYVVDHYAYVGSSGRFQLLGLLPAGVRPDLAYWRQVLGSTLDLGYVPSISRLSDYPECRPGKSPCTDLLEVRFNGPEPPVPGKATVVVATTGGPMDLQFDKVPGRREYVFNLDRLWFWGFARPAIPQAALEGGGAQVRIERRMQRHILY